MMPPLHTEPYWRKQGNKPFWTNGNGAGNEKMDAWGHLAFWSDDAEDFHKKAKQPWIASGNENDAEDDSHPMGLSLVQNGEEGKWADYWKIEDLNSKSSADFYKKAATPDLGSENEKDPENDVHVKKYETKSKLPWPLNIGIPGDGSNNYVV
jgi:hypothetical protein